MKTDTTTTVYRRANIAKSAAFGSLVKRFPQADIVSFVTKQASAEEAEANGLQEGELVFAATIREAEFPPKDDEGGGDDEPADDGPPAEDDGGGDEPPADDSGGDEGPPEGLGDEGGEKPKKLSPDEQIVHLLSEILTALKGGGGPGDLAPGPGDMADDLPDVGAPPAGGGLPGGPPHKAPPLPPPAKPKAPMGGPAFAHYDPESTEVTAIRVKASELGNKKMIEEAQAAYPTHKVARIQRTGSADLNGKRYNLPENDVAVVTLVRA